MKKIIVTFFVFLAVINCALAQRSESDIALREYFIDAEFFLAQEFYLDALNDYLQVYKRGYKDNANINYRIGVCYLNIPGQKQKSIEYLVKARESVSNNFKESTLSEKNAPADVHLYLGNAYRVNNQLEKAIESYSAYKKLLPEEEINLHKYADKQIEACNLANEFMAEPLNVEIKNLGKVINTSNDDYKAVISGDGNTLLFMHRLPFYDAVYHSKLENGAWTEPENITPQIMSDGDQYITAVSFDGRTILITREDEFDSDIMISRYVDNRWEKSEYLGSNINTKYWESHACLSKDEQTLYFTSNRKGGAGEMDIYYAQMTPEGIFGSAINLTEVNTELNEDTPFITADGTKLFFSSQEYTSMGGYDIFVSKLEEDGTWGIPKNLGYPLSTTDDDLFYYPVSNGNSAMLSRIDEEGFGGLDIYGVGFNELPQFMIEEEKPVEEPSTETIEEPAELTKAEEAVPDNEKEPVAVVEENIEPAVGIEEKPGLSTAVIANAEPVKESSETTQPDPDVPDTTPSEPAAKTPKEELVAEVVTHAEVKTIEIIPLLFGFDKSVLTTDGKKELDKIAELLTKNNELNIILTGFADPLGPESYNLRLSEYRAKSALKYLILKGVDGARIKAIGKGEVDFIAVNTNPDGSDNPQGRRFNRRVEFEISGLDASITIKRIDPVPPELKIK